MLDGFVVKETLHYCDDMVLIITGYICICNISNYSYRFMNLKYNLGHFYSIMCLGSSAGI